MVLSTIERMPPLACAIGMDDYLRKPLRAEETELKLRAVMLRPRTDGPVTVIGP